MRLFCLLSLFLALPVLACDKQAKDASRIAVAGGSITEILFYLGEESRIVAVDITSNYPEAAGSFPSIGYVRNLSAEGTLSLNPTLVLGEDDMGPEEILDQLAATNIEVIRVPEKHTAKGIIDKVICVATVVGIKKVKLEQIISPLREKADRLARLTSQDAPKVALLLSIRDGVPTAGGAGTSGHGVLMMSGAKNVFDVFSGWKPISMESMATSNPEYIVIPERGVQAAGGLDGVLDHPAVKLTLAGQNRNVLPVDGMSLLGFGPRTIETAVALADAIGSVIQEPGRP